MKDGRFIVPAAAGLVGQPPAAHQHAAGDLVSGTLDIARLPVAASGAVSAAAVVRADDSRLSDPRSPTAHGHAIGDVAGLQAALDAAGGGRTAFRNLVNNGGCAVSHRASKALSTAWQSAQVDLMAVRAEGTVGAGTILQEANAIGAAGYACKVAGASLSGAGTVAWRVRIEARDAVRLKNQAAVLSARVWHDTGLAHGWSLTVSKPAAADDFSSVVPIASGSSTVASWTETTLVLAIAAMGDCSTGIEAVVRAGCGAVAGKNFYLTNLQLEAGTAATAFEVRPVAVETALVHRLLRPAVITAGKANSTTNMQVAVAHPDMRTAPTYELTAPLAMTDGVTVDVTQSQASVTQVHERHAHAGRISCAYFSGLVSGTVYLPRGTGGVILASAEL